MARSSARVRRGEHLRPVPLPGARQRRRLRRAGRGAGRHLPLVGGAQLRHRAPRRCTRRTPTRCCATGSCSQPIPGLSPTINIGSSLGFWPALLITLAIQAVLGALGLPADLPPAAQPPARRQGGRLHRAHGPADRHRDLSGRYAGRRWSTRSSRRTTSASSASTSRSTGCSWPATIIGLGIVLTVLFRFTRFGLATRASAETEVGALVSGLSPDRIALINWIISFVVCGLAGILIAPLVPLQPGTYTLFIVPALAAAVVGRFHSLGWAIAAGLGIGGARVALGVPQRRPPRVPRRRRRAHPADPGAGGAGRPGSDHAEPGHARPGQARAGAAPALAAARPPSSGPRSGSPPSTSSAGNDRAALYSSMITAVITLSLVVVTGYTGQISLAQLTFAGVSAYILSTFATSWGIPFPIAPLLSALVAAAAGVVIGIPALRVRGLMLGVVTLTFAAGVEAIWFNNNSIDGGAGGLAIPTPAAVRHGPRHRVGQGLPAPGLRDHVPGRPACWWRSASAGCAPADWAPPCWPSGRTSGRRRRRGSTWSRSS